jgi:hypothetical protein
VKRLTTFGVAALATLALAAVFGPASASAATVFCAEPAVTCASEDILPAGSTLKGVVVKETGESKPMMDFSVGNAFSPFSCNYMQMNTINTAESGSPLPAKSDNYLNTSQCFVGKAACTKATINNPPTSVEATGAGTGIVKLGTASEPLTVSFECGGGYYNCTWAATSSPVSMFVEEGEMLIKSVPMSRVGTSKNCFGSGTLNLKAIIDTGEELVFISSIPDTVFCAEPAATCASEDILPAGSTLKGVVVKEAGESKPMMDFSVTSFLAPFNCRYMQMNTINTAERGVPLPAKSDNYLNVSQCFVGNGACTSATINNPPTSVEATGAGTGVVKLGTTSEPLTVSFECVWGSLSYACTWAPTSSPVSMFVEEGEMLIKEAPMSLVGTGKNCTSSAKLNLKAIIDTGEEVVFISSN